MATPTVTMVDEAAAVEATKPAVVTLPPSGFTPTAPNPHLVVPEHPHPPIPPLNCTTLWYLAIVGM